MTTTIEALQLACPDMREISFNEVREGDVIARHDGNDDYIVRTAHHFVEKWAEWVCADSYRVADKDSQMFLLHRPKRELPTEGYAMVRNKHTGTLFILASDGWINALGGHSVTTEYVESIVWERVYLTTQESDNA